MRKVIKNGIVITMDEYRKEKYEKLDIVIDDDTITDLVENYIWNYDQIIDATNKIVMPWLINAHTHLWMSFFRATNDNLCLDDWLKNKIWPIEDNLTEEDVYYGSLLSCVEMIKTGTVMSNDMYYLCDGTLKALKETWLRCLFSYCFMNINNDWDQRIETFKKIYDKYCNDNLIKLSIAVHAFYTADKEYIKKCSDRALELWLPVHIHFCENENEVKWIKETYGSLTNALKETWLLRNKLILAHTTFVDQECLDLLKNVDVSFVHNPVSNLNLGCGIADIVKYQKNNINVCLWTDGHWSGNNLNLFYHMSFVDFLQKWLYKDPTVFSSYETLKMATINWAKALWVENITWSIKIGKKADIIILDLNNIEIYPTVDLIVNVTHNIESSNIDTTIVNWNILMQNHKLTFDVDLENLKQKIDKIINNRLN